MPRSSSSRPALRLYGVDWDRGYCYTPHPDERAILSHVGGTGAAVRHKRSAVLLDADESPWNPRWFPYGSFPLYLLSTAAAAYETVPGLPLYSPCGGGGHDLRALGRVISALADVGTVAVVYLLARRMYGRREAILASTLVALAVIHIQLSHFFAVDTIATLCAVAGASTSCCVSAGRTDGFGTRYSPASSSAWDSRRRPAFCRYSSRSPRRTASTSWARCRSGRGRAPGRRTRSVRSHSGPGRGYRGGAGRALRHAAVHVPGLVSVLRLRGQSSREMVRRIRDYPYTRQYVDTIPYWYHFRQLSTWGLGWPLGLIAGAGLAYAALRGVRTRVGAGYRRCRRRRPGGHTDPVQRPARHRARHGRRHPPRFWATLAFRSHVSWPASHRARVGRRHTC